MATSRPEDAPRGLEFLYSLNRLNVATSRARCLTLVVASPALRPRRRAHPAPDGAGECAVPLRGGGGGWSSIRQPACYRRPEEASMTAREPRWTQADQDRLQAALRLDAEDNQAFARLAARSQIPCVVVDDPGFGSVRTADTVHDEVLTHGPNKPAAPAGPGHDPRSRSPSPPTSTCCERELRGEHYVQERRRARHRAAAPGPLSPFDRAEAPEHQRRAR